jgi:hypothetical protein
MARPNALQRLARMPLRDKALLAETVATLAWSSALIGLLPFKRVVATAEAPFPRRREAGTVDVQRLRRAVLSARRRVPWKAVCIQSALCLHLMLRRRGVVSVLHYGIASHSDAPLKAHVWLSVGGEILLGGEEAPNFTCVATFPAEAA